MKLSKVRVTEYRSIWDSNEFSAGQVTCLVGKNEAGKTSILQALYHLNPILDSDGEFDVTDDYGHSASARIVDPSDSARVFSWLLEATYDDRGNVCVYDYKAEDLVNVPNDVHERSRRDGAGVGAQKYLKRVRYGNTAPVRGNDLTISDLTTGIDFCFTVVFDYGEHHATAPTPSESTSWPCRQDPFSSFKARFGAQVIMSNAPWLDRRDQFDPGRIRLFDVDGSGTTDILYLGGDRITLFSNLAGNRWSAGQVVTTAFPAHTAASLSVVDLLGTGTGCLTWFTILPSEGAPRLRYIDLLDSKKPHLLVKQTNGMGLERLVSYAPSTKFYLEDVLAGVRWATKLPFPVHVVERVEVRDYLAGTRLVSTYRYRHGFFDGHEREFRGFGLVEQWDAQTVKSDSGTGSFPSDLFPVVEGEFVLPPVHTKTWLHTGAWRELKALTEVFRTEYYDGDSLAVNLPETAYSGVALASTEELREAARALKGMVLRQEVYADDGTTKASHPYMVSERCYEVRRIQPRTAGAAHAVFLAHPREELTYHYERESSDPRVLHALSLDVDDYGVVTKAATVAYKRRSPTGPASTEQGAMLVSVAEQQVVHKAGETYWYRIGVPVASAGYQLHGLTAPSGGGVLSLATVKAAVAGASVIAYDETPTSGHQLRVLSKERSIYLKDDLSAALAVGLIESLALLHHQEQLAFTGGLLTTVYGTTVTSTMLTGEGGYVAESGDYWAPSARPIYDAAHFFLPVGLVEPFGNQSSITYDTYRLLITEAHSSTTTTALDNVVTLENDYRVLQPKQLTDPNDNRTALAYDPLGMVIKTAVMGKASASEGDTLSGPTTQFSYDLWAFKNSGLPVVAHMQAREQHGGTAVWQHSYLYTDGSGRELLTKAQTAPAEGTSTARWVGTGRTVFDNKGNPIKKYEPYFSATSAYESEAAIVATGVTPILRYDPLGRLVRTDFPDGTFSKVVFDAWREEAWDQNDCALSSVWYDEHSDSGVSTQDQRAATLAAAHASTPTTTHHDALGRAVAVLQHNGFDGASPPAAILYETHTTLDILGNALQVRDARLNIPLAQKYDLLKRPIRVESAEAGISKVLPDITGVPVRAWNSRNVATRTTFDALRRPTHAYAKIDTASEMLVQRTLYGEELGSTASKAANLRGQLYRTYDSAGVVTHVAHDFKGNLLQTQRRLATSYTTTPDWSALASLTSVSAIESAAASSLETEVFTTSSTYDALNRVVTATTPDSSVAEPTYNEANQLVGMDVMIRGATSATSFVTDIYYNARGQRTKIAYANGVLTEYTYDSKSFRLTRLVSTRTSDSAVLQDLRYWFDPVGNIVETKDYADTDLYLSGTSPFASADSKYEYDALYRLTYAEGREHPSIGGTQQRESDLAWADLPHPNDTQALRRYAEEYSYDGVGNILEMTHTAGTNSWTRWYQYATASNKLTGTSDSGDTQDGPYANSTSYTDSYTHDDRGNMTSMPHLNAMEWDSADWLQHCDLGSGGGDSYFVYDAAGQRVRKIWVNNTSSIVDEQIYVGGYEVWRHHVSGTLEEERQTLHVMDDLRRVAMVETKTINGGSTLSSPTSYLRYQLDDHLGSARVEVDGTGALLTYEEYHPYGTTAFRASSGATGFAPKRYRYTGKERDEETGLYYYGARYYPPWLARWTAVDPKVVPNVRRTATTDRDVSGDQEESDDAQGQQAGVERNPRLLNVYEFSFNNAVTYIDPDGREPVYIGDIYVIEATVDGQRVVYVGQTGQELKDRFSSHRWKEIIQAKDTKITRTKVYGELDIAASGKKSVRSARREALGVIEEYLRRSYEKRPGIKLLSEDPAVSEENLPKFEKTHKVTMGETSLYKAGNLIGGIGAVMDVVAAYKLLQQIQLKNKYIMAPYVLEDQFGMYTLQTGTEYLVIPTYEKHYISGKGKGLDIPISAEEFGRLEGEAKALWGYIDSNKEFVPGLLQPRLYSPNEL